MNDILFFDTYAIIELIRGNVEYKKFGNAGMVTTVFNLAELNYSLKKFMPKEKADWYSEKCLPFVAEVSFSDIIKAMDFKSTNRDFSIPDSIGYILAGKLGVKFLTGDSGFKDFPNVEFVK